RSYDEQVNGGTPYEKGVLVDPSIGRKDSTSLLRSMMASNKQPRLIIRLTAPTKEQKELMDSLPPEIISSTSYITYLSFYRQFLADALLRDTTDIQSSELLHSPTLSLFPVVAEQPDLMDILRMGWAERLRNAKRSDKVCFH
ncbi:hypothetical protein CAPTEDRAFT_120958, partial [Capitella teleta]